MVHIASTLLAACLSMRSMHVLHKIVREGDQMLSVSVSLILLRKSTHLLSAGAALLTRVGAHMWASVLTLCSKQACLEGVDLHRTHLMPPC